MVILIGLVLLFLGTMGAACKVIEHTVFSTADIPVGETLTYFDLYQVIAERMEHLFHFCLIIGVVGFFIVICALVVKFAADRIKCETCGRWYDKRYLVCPHCATDNPFRVVKDRFSKK